MNKPETLIDNNFVIISGKACLVELKMKLLLSRDKNEIKKESCSDVKKLIFDQYLKYLDEKDKKSINDAVNLRNNLVHFNFYKILEEQSSIPSKVTGIKVNLDPSILKRISEGLAGKNTPVDKDSNLYGQYLEIGSNGERIQKMMSVLDDAIKIITRVTNESPPKT